MTKVVDFDAYRALFDVYSVGPDPTLWEST